MKWGKTKKTQREKREELRCKGVQIIEMVDENEKGGRIKRDFLKT